MLHSSSSKGQTEPLAALVAVIVLGLAIVLYGGFVTDVLTDRTDRTSDDVAIDLIWDDISHDGVYSSDRGTDLSDIEMASLPQGQNVYVEVTIIDDDGHERVVDDLHFDSDGTRASPQEGPPEDGSEIETQVSERPIPVETDVAGDVRGGTLHVEVWSP
ncbi:DUF7285 family protein [Natronorubrum texcoconense]|uniref:Uncharacterized protein n=1 Tax=Natronorubrum texcoconense TaxID=1095776 RepID=A0A1G8TV38_9EURY|nr:hypothetical protein [Natronorubrum texcoconense]SDJ45264.1 hypothetical protein SAMN04515672_0615 [Natronorubrum texcoconense]